MKSTSDNAAAAPLEDALAKNVEATEEVKQVADNLAVVHAVLEKAPEGAPVEDIEMAVEQAATLKEQLSTAAEKLDDVNDTLAEQLESRRLDDRKEGHSAAWRSPTWDADNGGQALVPDCRESGTNFGEPTMSVKTLLVEDNATIRAHLVPTMRDLADAEVIGVVETEADARYWLTSHAGELHLVVIDLLLKEGSGLNTV